MVVIFFLLGLSNSACATHHSCEETTHFEPEFRSNGSCDHRYLVCEKPENCGLDCTPDSCTNCTQSQSGSDLDQDSIPDLLEHQLAYKFFPDIELQSLKDDVKESYFFNDFTTPYTVNPIQQGTCDEQFECLELKVSITFFNDTGAIFGLGSHNGDAEMYMAVLQRNTPWNQARSQSNSWTMIRDFTSAHWKQSFWDSSKMKIYSPPKESRVRVYSSERKHALYHSRAECNKGAYWFDDCPNKDAYNLRGYLESNLQNVGSEKNHQNMDTTISSPSNECTTYDVWSDENFDGELFREYFSWPVNWRLSSPPDAMAN